MQSAFDFGKDPPMPRIVKSVPITAGNRQRCVLFLDEWPKGRAKGLRGEIDGEEFELLTVHLDGGESPCLEPCFAIDVTNSAIDADNLAGKELREL